MTCRQEDRCEGTSKDSRACEIEENIKEKVQQMQSALQVQAFDDHGQISASISRGKSQTSTVG